MFDNTKERIDYSNPDIQEYSVFYSTIPLTQEELDLIKERSKLSEYPEDHDILMAIYLSMCGNNEEFNLIKGKIDSVDEKYQ